MHYFSIWNFEKIFNKFLEKIGKMPYLSIFFKKSTNHALIFCAFGRKTIYWKFWENFWWKFNRKMNFYFIFILENLLLKIEPSEITPLFYNNFFGFRGLSPRLRPCILYVAGDFYQGILWCNLALAFSLLHIPIWLRSHPFSISISSHPIPHYHHFSTLNLWWDSLFRSSKASITFFSVHSSHDEHLNPSSLDKS